MIAIFKKNIKDLFLGSGEEEQEIIKEELEEAKKAAARLEKEKVVEATTKNKLTRAEIKAAEKAEKERAKKESEEKERLEKIRLKTEKEEKERVEKLRLENERLEKIRLEAESKAKKKEEELKTKEEQIRAENERLEKARLDAENEVKEKEEALKTKEEQIKEENERLEKARLDAENEVKEKEEALKTKEEQIKEENERLAREKEELEKTKKLNLEKIRKEIEEEMLAKMTDEQDSNAQQTFDNTMNDAQNLNATPIQNNFQENSSDDEFYDTIGTPNIGVSEDMGASMNNIHNAGIPNYDASPNQDFDDSGDSGFTVTDMDDMGTPAAAGGSASDAEFYDTFPSMNTPFGAENTTGNTFGNEPNIGMAASVPPESNTFESGGGDFTSGSATESMAQPLGDVDAGFYDTFETGDASMSQIPDFEHAPGVSAKGTPEQSLVELKNFWSYNDNRERRSIIADDVKVFGNIISGGHIEINGEVKGDITAKGKVEIHGDIKGNVIGDKVGVGGSWVSGDVTADTGILTAPDATIVGDLETDNIIIGGSIKGDIDATETAVFDEKAVFLGDIKARTFIVKQGARIKGTVESISQDSIEGTFVRRKRAK